MRLQSAIFDMDGTLIDSMGMWRSLGRGLLERHGITPPEDLDEIMKPLNLQEGTAWCKEYGKLSEPLEVLIQETWPLVERFYRHEVKAKPGVRESLSILKMEGVWMYIATATDRPLAEAALKQAGLDGYFRGIVTCEEAGQGKEQGPEVYERALRRLRSNKKDTVVFEDALHAVKTAKNAGFRVAAVYDPSAENDQDEMQRIADYYCRSFEELFQTKEL